MINLCSWLLLAATLHLCQAHLVLTRERREVGPVMKSGKKYRRLQHSIMVQSDIRSRSVIFLLIFWRVCTLTRQFSLGYYDI